MSYSSSYSDLHVNFESLSDQDKRYIHSLIEDLMGTRKRRSAVQSLYSACEAVSDLATVIWNTLDVLAIIYDDIANFNDFLQNVRTPFSKESAAFLCGMLCLLQKFASQPHLRRSIIDYGFIMIIMPFMEYGHYGDPTMEYVRLHALGVISAIVGGCETDEYITRSIVACGASTACLMAIKEAPDINKFIALHILRMLATNEIGMELFSECKDTRSFIIETLNATTKTFSLGTEPVLAKLVIVCYTRLCRNVKFLNEFVPPHTLTDGTLHAVVYEFSSALQLLNQLLLLLTTRNSIIDGREEIDACSNNKH